MAIQEITSALTTPASIGGAGKTSSAQKAGGSAFSSLIDAVEATNAESNSAVSGMLDGSVDVHDAMIALQRADMTLQLSIQIRNKLVQSYQEIMRMPV